VLLDRAPTDIGSLADLRSPPKIGIRRTTRFQLHKLAVGSGCRPLSIASNGEIALVLYSIPAAKYMNAYFPNRIALSKRTRDRAGILAARRAFTEPLSARHRRLAAARRHRRTSPDRLLEPVARDARRITKRS